jgi:hypothetical protein
VPPDPSEYEEKLIAHIKRLESDLKMAQAENLHLSSRVEQLTLELEVCQGRLEELKTIHKHKP